MTSKTTSLENKILYIKLADYYTEGYQYLNQLAIKREMENIIRKSVRIFTDIWDETIKGYSFWTRNFRAYWLQKVSKLFRHEELFTVLQTTNQKFTCELSDINLWKDIKIFSKSLQTKVCCASIKSRNRKELPCLSTRDYTLVYWQEEPPCVLNKRNNLAPWQEEIPCIFTREELPCFSVREEEPELNTSFAYLVHLRKINKTFLSK